MTLTKQLWWLRYIRVTHMFSISMPVIVVYWLDHGFSNQDIFILQAIFAVAVILFEIPSGYVADRLGYERTLVTGLVFGTLGFITYATMPSYWGFVLAEIILALGASCLSGTESALLRRVLNTANRGTEFTKIEGNHFSYGNLSEAIAALAATGVAAIAGIPAVLYVQAFVYGIGIIGAVKLYRYSTTATRPLHHCEKPNLWRALYGNPAQVALQLLIGTVGASTLIMVWFVQPQWLAVGINPIWFGILWFAYKLVTSLGARYAYLIKASITPEKTLWLIGAIPIAGYLVLGLAPTTIVLVLLAAGFWMLRGIAKPLLSDLVLNHSEETEYATTLSVGSLLTRLVFVVVGPLVGGVADVYSLGTAYLATAALLSFLVVPSLLILTRSVYAR